MNCIVTGASRGIGREIVKKLAQPESHRVIAIARSINQLHSLTEECRTAGCKGEVIPFPFDIEQIEHAHSRFLEDIQQHFNTVNVLVNNAGYLSHSGFGKFSMTEARKLFEINFFAAAKIIQLLLPLLQKAEWAHVVNISSMGGFQGSSKFPGLSFYSASKAALSNLTECLAEEYNDTAVRFNALALGAVQTEMLETAFPGIKTPLQPAEMASYIADFASSGHRFFNGKNLPVAVSTP